MMAAVQAQVDRADLEAALGIAAQLVARDGPKFLPIFLRLESEVEALDGQRSALDRALAAARQAGKIR